METRRKRSKSGCEDVQVHQNGLTDKKHARTKVVLGAQWGDEGKGKIVDLLAKEADVVCRCQGGNNAGHTVVVEETEYHFHLLPSGIIHPECKAVLGNGVVIHLPSLFKELEDNKLTDSPDWSQRLVISDRAHIVFDFHQAIDGMQEGEMQDKKIGTTKKGIGPTYSTKAFRSNLRICDLLGDFVSFEKRFRELVSYSQRTYPALDVSVDEEVQKYKDLAAYITKYDLARDTVSYLNKKLQNSDCTILIEGANGAMLDIDFGTYPYVTSSNCTIGGVCTGLGIPPHVIDEVIGIMKAYTTRVGEGCFPSEQCNEIGEQLQNVGKEFGVTTARKRRCGWLDLMLLRYSHMINGYTALALTKLDVLDDFEEIKIGTGYRLNGEQIHYVPSNVETLSRVEVMYETLPGWKKSTAKCRTFDSLPDAAQKYVLRIQDYLGVKVKWIGVGKERASLITCA